MGRSKECFLELNKLWRCERSILFDLFPKAPLRGAFIKWGIDTDGRERTHDVGIGDVEYTEGVGAQLSHRIPSKFASQNNAEEWVEMMVCFGQGQDGPLDLLGLVFRVFRVASPCYLDECRRLADRRIRSASLEDIVQIMAVAVAILLGHPRASAGGTFSLVIEVELMTISDFLQLLA